MAADNVSLGEITSVKGDADLAYGAAGNGGTNVVLPPSEAVAYLNNAAKLKAANDQWKYEQYTNALKENVKNLPDINGIRGADNKDITSDYKKLLGMYAENPSMLINPTAYPDQWKAAQELEGSLRGDVAESKYNLATEKTSADTLLNNPELNSPENQKALSDFRNMSSKDIRAKNFHIPLSKPLTYDPNKPVELAKAAAEERISTDTKDQNIMKAAGITNVKDYIATVGAISYKRHFVDALKSINNTYSIAGNAGATNRSVLFSAYKKSGGTGDANSPEFNDWESKQYEAIIPADQTSTKIDVDKGVMQNKEIALTQQQGAANRENAWRIANLTHDYEMAQLEFQKSKDPNNAELGSVYNKALPLWVKTGALPEVFGQNMFGSNKEVEVKAGTKVADLDADITGHTFKTAETTIKMPERKFLSSEKMPNGDLKITVMDYTKTPQIDMPTLDYSGRSQKADDPNGKRGVIETTIITPQQAQVELGNLYGGGAIASKIFAAAKKRTREKRVGR